jgi:diguanylate cyclase
LSTLPTEGAPAAPPTSLRRSLFLHFAALTVFSVALLVLAYVLFALKPMAERIARSQFVTAVEKIDSELGLFFRPVATLVSLSRDWATHSGFDNDNGEDFNGMFMPMMRKMPQVTSVVAGDTQGHGWMLLKLPDGQWRNRFTDVKRHGQRQRFIEWDGKGSTASREEIIDYDARTRPWFTLAMSAPADGRVHWTEPYTFFTTRDPGITASSRVDLPAGGSLVIGFDIKLLDISRITAPLVLGSGGSAMVITNDGRVLGMPRTGRGFSDDVVRDAVLQPVEALGITAATDVVNEWRRRGQSAATDLSYVSDNQAWIASSRPFRLGEQTFWTIAFAPSADFQPPWLPVIMTLIGMVALVMLLALLVAHRFTRQFSAPLESLVASSERIARLDFSSTGAVQTRLAELQRLAAAQEAMRGMLSEFRKTVDEQADSLRQQIENLRATESRLEHLSQHDPLTDLPNRALFNDRIAHAITRARRSKRLFALLFIDLDNFKMINDTCGHEAGDLLLIEVARRLRNNTRSGDTLARIGGDEFVMLAEDLGDTLSGAVRQAEVVAEKIRDALAKPYRINKVNHNFTASIGVTIYHDSSSTADSLLRSADGAMYRAKHGGRNQVKFFDPTIQAEQDVAAQIDLDLRGVIEGDQLRLLFHQQYDRGNRVTGAEVLLRWQHPGRGIIDPENFISIAERSGLILPIGLWVIDAACAQLGRWAASAHTRELRLSVNVSARQFHDSGFVENVERALRQNGTRGDLLTLELTETMVMENSVHAVARMHDLKSLGVRLSMDDFGTGYSSLAQLSRLPFDEVKIDQSFVHKLGQSPNDNAIVHAIINMAQSLGLQVIAEGVESREQLEWLMQKNCDCFQGYLFSRPMPLEQFEASLSETDGNAGKD